MRRGSIGVMVSALAAVTSLLASCASDSVASGTEATVAASSSTTTMPAATTIPPTSTTTTGTTTTGATSTTTARTTTTSTTTTSTTSSTTSSAPEDKRDVVEVRTVGTSVEGRPIAAVRKGTPGGRVVLVIGAIHGDEDDGLAILGQLDAMETPDGIDLWLVESMNPDGVAAETRHNANGVDLNRNFPYNWGPIGALGDWQYAGPGPASEPETQAMVSFITEIQPDLVIWYHQDYYRIAPSTGRDGTIRARYSELTGIPLLSISGGTYTGVAATWARRSLDGGVAFIVELGPTLSSEEAAVHAEAVLTIAAEDD